MRREDVTFLEELNFNAWPALETLSYDGWIMRRTGGASRRVNSVNCLSPGTLPLSEKIAMAERTYETWRRPVIFRLTPLAEEALEPLLIARGYRLDAPTFVQLADAVAHPVAAEVQVFARPDARWIEAAVALRGIEGDEAAIFKAQHEAIRIETRWVLIAKDREPLAVGAAAIENGWAGLHGIYVSSNARRRGTARQISQALIGLTHASGARRVWLQVEQGNAPAIALYAGLGFQTVYAYHHRIAPEQRG